MDVLADLLRGAGVHGAAGARIHAGEDWGWWNAARPGAAFHAVTAGTAWVGLPDEPPRQLMAGDVLLLPRGAAHAIGSDPAAVARTTPAAMAAYARTPDGTVTIGAAPFRTRVMCAHYVQDPLSSTALLSLLPDVVHLRAGDGGPALDDTLRLLGRELADAGPATDLVLDSVVHILLVQLLRAWLAQAPETALPSWLRALRDPVVAAALAEIHAAPARPWTTETLAAAIAVSRATLTRRFAAVAGTTPGAYLTTWRMNLAARMLRDGDDSLEAVAADVGYQSVYAFSRAFRRAHDVPPGRFRARSRAAPAAA